MTQVKSFLTPNEFSGSDTERINQAVQAAAAAGIRVVVPAQNQRADGLCNVWLLDAAILLPANTSLELDNCHLKLSDRCRDNFIRSANCGLGIEEIKPLENIRITGRGRVVLEGADNPRATGDSAKTIGERTYGTDAGKEGVSQTGDWRNIGILLAYVENFTIENLHIKDSHCWAVSLERCAFGKISNLDFESLGKKKINGKWETILNQDGLDLRQGCHDISIENITGRTGDDLIALTNIAGKAPSASGSESSTMVSSTRVRPDGQDDICNISIRNVRGYCSGRHHVVRFLNVDDLGMKNIILDGLLDTSPPGLPCKATVKIGDTHYGNGKTPLGKTSNFFISNVNGASEHTILIAGSLVDSCITNVIRNVPGENVITYASGRDNVRRLLLSNLLARFPESSSEK